ncbi:MAG: DUF3576 domain-containing protein [Alphaproteobacteria bacterium]|nr:DUF3576 domain-containing protein [Alphaproteobacteria bacterium]MCD8526126.1 DUF3576 domain-containing protein [Alphaproteobacteria bacterium]MCD8569939.1 DUF3576 domain-containing protein [Alphaproteobacteria bacterium]
MKTRLLVSSLSLGLTALLLASCGSGPIETEARYPTGADRAATGSDIYADEPSIFGPEGLDLFGTNKKKEDAQTGIGVNSFLWRAALDTVSFMPLASADPFGGVILTDWYTSPEKENERFKVDVFILTRELRSDGISVRVYKQELKKGTWRDMAVEPDTARKLEDAILTRARQLRVAQLESK